MAVTKTTTQWKQFTIVRFTGTGSTTLRLPPPVLSADVLTVAGGGGGGAGSGGGGGGGAGGLVYQANRVINPGKNYTVIIGAGGTANVLASGGDGGNSVFDTITALGGGGGGWTGGSPYYTVGRNGGSGGGGCSVGSTTANGGTKTQGDSGGGAGYGNNGGNATGNTINGGGGGGAGAVGANSDTNKGGNGGIGRSFDITGVAAYYGGGGGAGKSSTDSPGTGGSGGGGNGGSTTGYPGTDGLGGGGGGGSDGNVHGGVGGSGIVIIRYLTPFLRSTGWIESGPYEGTEYAFDPVNVDHERTPGVDAFLYEQSFASVNVTHSRTLASFQECEMGAVNVYHARYPVFSWDRVITNPVDDESGNLIGVTVSRGMDDAMTQADFDYDGTTVEDIFGNDYMTKIQVPIPDYNGVSRVVFVGIAPSSRAHYEPAKDKLTLTAVDYGLYLTQNPLEDKDLALLPPANQAAEGSNIAKILFFNYGIIPFQVGQRVVGGISGATGTIIEVYAGMSLRMTLYPAQGVFQDDEPLLVGGVQYATADGRSMDTSYTPLYLPVYPEDWIRSVLGGDNWMRVTGIEPYRIVSSGDYWDTDLCPAVPFMFGSKESINDAMNRLAKYMKYIKLIKPRDIGGGNYRPAFYWVPLSRIDEYDGLDLPAAVSITGPNDPFLAAPFELEQNGDNQVDRIKLMCQDLYGNWLVSSKGTPYANAGEGPIRTYYDEPQDICTQTDLDAYCDDLYDLLTPRGMVWHATLLERSDLEIYQLLTISGYGSEIPNGTYRIIRISYERGCAKNLTHITFMLATAFSTLRKYGMTYIDSISEIQRIIKHMNDQKPQTELGTCTATDGTTVTYETEAASKGRGRDGTAVGLTSGTIIAGAKIIIHSTRGGVICLPVVGEAATGTGLSTVGVPTIISALRDETDHNYWFLKWALGVNNTGVSVNIQTESYPTAPGVVTGPGTTSGLYAGTTIQLRIRFSGPSTTYYVKLWGERNGAYSSTGVTTTIESGADVTVGPAEDPESIGVIDRLLTTGLGHPASAYAVPHDYEVFNSPLPFLYTGTDNIYIGGPKNQSGTFLGSWAAGYIGVDDHMTIYGPKGSLALGGSNGTWRAPINIKNLLNVGSNTIRIVVTDVQYGYYGCSDLYIRTYFGAD